MFDSVRITTWLFIPFLLFLKVSSLKIKLFKNFQGCFTVQLSRFLSCFSVVSLPEQLWYHIIAFSVCQQLFSTFLFLFIGAVLISEVCIRLFLCLCGVFRSDVLHNTTTFLRCQHLFLKFFNFFVFHILYLFFIHLRLFFSSYTSSFPVPFCYYALSALGIKCIKIHRIPSISNRAVNLTESGKQQSELQISSLTHVRQRCELRRSASFYSFVFSLINWSFVLEYMIFWLW